MSKETGSYESLIRGVSEQVPQDRYVGQHWVQENMVSDPVRGLARRRGSVMLSEKLYSGLTLDAASLADLKTYKEFTFFVNSVEYSLMYRPGTKVSGSTMPGLICINKATGVVLDVVAAAADTTAVTACLDGGMSAVGNIAKYLLMAPNNKTPTFTSTDMLAATKQYSVVWVKQGAYSRTYTIKVTTVAGVTRTATYTTDASYYSGSLDLTTANAQTESFAYTKELNKAVYAYSTAVNQWIATSAADIQPASIAAGLRTAIVAAGYPSANVIRNGSHLEFTDAEYIEVDDGGDGSYMKGIAKEIQSVNDLSPIHWPGKTVRVRPKGVASTDANGVYYIQAAAKTSSSSTWGEVSWTEGPGIKLQPTFVFLLSEIIGNTLYVATTQDYLAAVSGDTNQTAFSASTAGDATSQPTPVFLESAITHILNFQDRLAIVSNSTVFMSKSANYFTFFRSSVLTLEDDDPIEMYALGSEGDLINSSVQLDRSVLLFGKQQQYALDGRSVMTPKTASISPQSSHEDANVCPPVASGNYVFFTQTRDEKLTVQQMQTGDYQDSFRVFDITSQLDGYLNGTPRQIVAATSPTGLYVRTQELTNGFYTFQYLDSADQTQRYYDAWSKWTFNEVLGNLVGITTYNGTILALTARQGTDGVYLVLDKFSRSADLSTNPYLDSMRLYGSGGTLAVGSGYEASCGIAANKSAGDYFLLGQTLTDYQKLLDSLPEDLDPTSCVMVGALYDSQFEPTAPYMRDKNDKAILDGTLILGSYKVTLAKSAAMRAYLRGFVDDTTDEVRVCDWIYRPSGSWMLNVQQIAATVSVPIDIQQEIREYRLRIASRNWLPMTISSIEWAGQFYTQRNG